jgi:hypothetical protein
VAARPSSSEAWSALSVECKMRDTSSLPIGSGRGRRRRRRTQKRGDGGGDGAGGGEGRRKIRM